MGFRVAARTVLQLGAELISSDAVAFYELVKNAFDACSQRVEVRVVIRVPYQIVEECQAKLKKGGLRHEEIAAIKEQILQGFVVGAPQVVQLREQLDQAVIGDDLLHLLAEANFIEIEDTGEGMSLDDLEHVYLTIGTPLRLKQREQRESQINASATNTEKVPPPILGEKGIGRLSVMRLGQRLLVTTSRKEEPRWNTLSIDWGRFSQNPDELIDSIELSPSKGAQKADKKRSGTTIRISALNSDWTKEKLAKIAQDEFGRLMDPFTPHSRFYISLRFNNEPLPIPSFDKLVLKHAHAVVTAKFFFDENGQPVLQGKFDYVGRQREKYFEEKGVELFSRTKWAWEELRRLGPFTVEFYWFNRQLLRYSKDKISDYELVVKLQKMWAGGLMLFRDGFRVYPYGSEGDDWLKLDPKALGSSGYKVNRSQIIGKVDITGSHNPHLQDQTNREGLRDNEEFHAFVRLLQTLLEKFKEFLNQVDNEKKAKEPVSFDDLQVRFDNEGERIEKSIAFITQKYPELEKETGVVGIMKEAAGTIRAIMGEANQLASEYEKGRTEVLHLAGLGLMVEFISHELNRATQHTVATLIEAERKDLPGDIKSLFATLRAQLKTIEKRLSILDPLSTAGRQRKEVFDLVELTADVLKSHEAQFQRHQIEISPEVQPEKQQNLKIKAVPGMIVQILENLISNSVYWLKAQQKLDKSFKPWIEVIIDTTNKQIQFTDNGPGVKPDRKEDIFQPFVTTKPPGEGKGLGLYISKEVAAHNEAALYLSDEHSIHPDRLNTFVLDLEAKGK